MQLLIKALRLVDLALSAGLNVLLNVLEHAGLIVLVLDLPLRSFSALVSRFIIKRSKDALLFLRVINNLLQ